MIIEHNPNHSRLAKNLPTLAEFDEKFFYIFDLILIILTVILLLAELFSSVAWLHSVMAGLAFLGLVPVIISTIKSLVAKRISVDLLAAIALIFSFISKEWTSAAFITLMLAFARIFDQLTQARAKKTIQGLMKYHVENVRIRVGDSLKEVHISQATI